VQIYQFSMTSLRLFIQDWPNNLAIIINNEAIVLIDPNNH
jgi:hypothetical protein